MVARTAGARYSSRVQTPGDVRCIATWMLPVAACLAVVVAARADAAQLSATSITERTLHKRIVVRTPLGPCSVPQTAAAIAASVYVPFGAEFLPGDCARDDSVRASGGRGLRAVSCEL